jgi:ferredoxin
MEGDGPSNGTPFHSGLVIAGDDAVAVDACACGIFGYAPEDIPMLKILGQKALGVIKPDEIIVKGDGVSRLEYSGATPSGSDFLYKFPEPLFKVATYFLSCRPVIDREKCGLCGLCAEACSRNAIRKSHGSYKIQKTKCILCMCCLEACPFHAVSLISRGMRIKAFYRRVKAFFRNIFH